MDIFFNLLLSIVFTTYSVLVNDIYISIFRINKNIFYLLYDLCKKYFLHVILSWNVQRNLSIGFLVVSYC